MIPGGFLSFFLVSVWTRRHLQPLSRSPGWPLVLGCPLFFSLPSSTFALSPRDPNHSQSLLNCRVNRFFWVCRLVLLAVVSQQQERPLHHPWEFFLQPLDGTQPLHLPISFSPLLSKLLCPCLSLVPLLPPTSFLFPPQPTACSLHGDPASPFPLSLVPTATLLAPRPPCTEQISRLRS